MYCRLNQAIINGCKNVCYQGIIFTVPFCEHSHTIAKIDGFVMVHPDRNGFTLRLTHPCTNENIARHNVGIDIGMPDHCLGRTHLQLIATIIGSLAP